MPVGDWFRWVVYPNEEGEEGGAEDVACAAIVIMTANVQGSYENGAVVGEALGPKTCQPQSWTNAIHTSQYNWWNFVPLNILQQVLIPANAYFLLMAILQLVPQICKTCGYLRI